MFLLRSVALSDLKDIHELSRLMNFINLPSNIEQLESLILKSNKTFLNPSKKLEQNYYMFVVEDLINKRVVGTSLIHAQHGTPEEPHFYLRVGQEYKFSQTLNTGFVHGTLKLGIDTNGPTEIGALLLNPSMRSNGQKIGKQISFVRFLYLSMYPDRFRPKIHAELMPPFDSEGNSPLWEAIGRRFLNMDYFDADELSRKNKEFILSLYPSENIYQTLLPTEARVAIGQVGESTIPVKKMLEDIGFQYINEVDPFDGGPHFQCPVNMIKPIKDKIHGKVKALSPNIPLDDLSDYLLELPKYEGHHFTALKTKIIYKDSTLFVPSEILEKFPDLESELSFSAIPF